MNFHLTTDEFTQENSIIIWVAHVSLHGLQYYISGLLALFPDAPYNSLYCEEGCSK